MAVLFMMEEDCHVAYYSIFMNPFPDQLFQVIMSQHRNHIDGRVVSVDKQRALKLILCLFNHHLHKAAQLFTLRRKSVFSSVS